MQAHRPPPAMGPRLDPRLIEVATRHAHALRSQAIDDTLRRLGCWLRRRFSPAPKGISQWARERASARA